MDSMMIKKVEHECAHKCFEESTSQVPQFRGQLVMLPSDVLQARTCIAFDAACRMDLATMSPLQMQRLVALKQDLIGF